MLMATLLSVRICHWLYYITTDMATTLLLPLNLRTFRGHPITITYCFNTDANTVLHKL